MDNRTLILLFTCFVPLFTAVVGTIIEAISLQDSVTVRETHVKRMLMCYFLMFIFIGTGVATGVALPKITIQILPLTVFSLYIAPVLYYRFVYLLTNTENKETSHFSRHYLFPVLSALGFCAFFYIVPPAIRCNWWWKGLLPVIRSLPLSSKRFRWYSSPLPSYICRSYSESWQYVTAKTGQKVFCGRNGFTFPFSYAVSPSFGRERSA